MNTQKFQTGDKAYKPKGYKFPCTIVSVFQTTSGETRLVGEMEGNGMLHIFNENQLEHSTGEESTIQIQQKLIGILKDQIQQLCTISKIDLGDDVIKEILRLQSKIQ